MTAVPYWASDDGDVQLHLGDCLDVLPGLPSNSVDAIVTDPPYALEFMGASWDTFTGNGFRRSRNPADVGRDNVFGRTSRTSPEYITGQRVFQEWCERWAREALRVLKPGGWMLAFGGTRTWHRLVCGVEDAGFEVRDSVPELTGQDAPGLMWIHGQGFPKSLDVERAVAVVTCVLPGRHFARSLPEEDKRRPDDHVCPVTPESEPWSGFGTALKPAWEPVMVARKPLEGSVAGNVLRYGTGALNVDGCRVAHDEECKPVAPQAHYSGFFGQGGRHEATTDLKPEGRWPTNLVFTHSAACEPAGTRQVRGSTQGTRRGGGRTAESNYRMRDQDRDSGYADADGLETVEAWVCAADCPVGELDRQSGVLASGALKPYAEHHENASSYQMHRDKTYVKAADSGGASRFYPVFKYQAKAPAPERPRLEDGTAHETVKPLGFISWAVRLVTPPGGTVLDMFAGSGPVGEACIIEGFRAVLIEQDPKSADLTRKRLGKPIQPVMFGLDAS